MKYLVSACLAGIPCRFDGKEKTVPEIKALYEQWQAIPVCPELLAWLWVPRIPCEGGWKGVIGEDGKDYTELFLVGAKKTLEIIQENNIHTAILRSKSPSCWCGKIFDGTFSDTLIDGDGVTTKLLKEHGIQCMSEKKFLDSYS